MSKFSHIPVLLKEVISLLNIKPEGTYIDCTLGGGGHSKAILNFLTTGHLYSFDKDYDAILYVQNNIDKFKNKWTIIHDDYINFDKYITSQVDGVILDAGVSSYQIDEGKRGFSYQKNGPLNMRMDNNQDIDAYHIVNTFDKKSLCDLFYQYGEEKHAKSIAYGIIKTREKKPISTTFELVDIIKNFTPKTYHLKKHPAKKVFQALRIMVNNELTNLQLFLDKIPNFLKPQAKLLVISFHSLEDRIVKQNFKKLTTPHKTPKLLPVMDNDTTQFHLPFNKPIISDALEIKNNPRCKSAKLRIVIKKG